MSSNCDKNEKHAEFLWKIENFTNAGHRTGQAIISPIFSLASLFDTDWRLRLYPRGKKNEKFLSCYLEYHQDNRIRTLKVNFEISVLLRGGTVYKTRKAKSRYIRLGNRIGYSHFCTRQSVASAKDVVLSRDTLTLKCRFILGGKDDDTRGSEDNLEELSNSFRNLLEGGEFSDLTLNTSEADYKVHRVIIHARAPDLASQLGIDDGEIITTRIRISDMTPQVLRALLMYLYAGRLENLDAGVLADLYGVAERYNLVQLKRHIFPGPMKSTARTRIEVVRKSILWQIENFSQREKDEDNPLHKMVNLGLVHLLLTCCFASDSQGEDCVQVCARFMPPRTARKIYFRCKALVVGTINHSIASQECERWFDRGNSNLSFPILNLKKNHIFQNVVYLPNDVLQLSLKMAVSDSCQTSRMESTQCLWTGAIEEDMKFLSLCHLRDDLRRLWKSLDFTDATVQVKDGDEFAVHKAILAVRSPVLHGMLRGCSVEDCNIQLDLSGMDLGIAYELFKYVYRGETHAYSFESYVQLYVAAMKYGMLSLVKLCEGFLIANITVRNACEILILAEVHQDKILSKAAEEYISEYRYDVLNSKEWSNLVENHPNLGSKLLLWLSTQVLIKNE